MDEESAGTTELLVNPVSVLHLNHVDDGSDSGTDPALNPVPLFTSDLSPPS